MLDPLIERRNKDAVMGLGEHLDELRSRLIWALVGLLPILIVACVFGWSLVKLMLAPLRVALHDSGRHEAVQVTSALETFSAYFYVVVLASLIVGGPWLVYQLWKFVAPGLYANERRFAYVLAPLSLVLGVLGVMVMYFAMLPLGLAFLINFGSDQLVPITKTAPLPAGVTLPTLPLLDTDPDKPTPGQMWLNTELRQIRVAVPVAAPATPNAPPAVETFALSLQKPSSIDVNLKLDQYVDLFVNLALVFALAFQLPVVMLLLGWSGLVKPELFAKYRKHAVAASVIGAALVSPTGDPISLAVLQVPLYLLYELGMLLMKILPAHRVAGRREPDEGDD